MFDLSEWKRVRIGHQRKTGETYGRGRGDVTVVAYAFAVPERMPSCIESIEFALRETYRWCGLLKTTLVVNSNVERLDDLRSEFGEAMRIDIDDTLKPGDIVGFSRNMIRTLPARFDTPFVLNVHPDGFPLRNGLDEFVGLWDYIGGPWSIVDDDFMTKVFLTRNDGAGNGGFTLRSRKICELGASAYRRFWKAIPDCYLLYEDIFFTRFLPRWHPGYAKHVSLAPRSEALKFSVAEQLASSDRLEGLPFGFHSWRALREIYERVRGH